MVRTKPILVEFTGLAGSGKSFLREQLSKNLGIERRLPDTKVLLFAMFFRPDFLRIAYACFKVVIISKPKTKALFVNSFIHLLVVQILYLYSIITNKKIFILDDGFFQKIRAVRRNSQYEFGVINIPEILMNKLLLPDMVVLVDVMPEVINERRFKRDGFKYPDIQQAVKRIDLTLDDIKNTNTIKLIRFDNTSSEPDITGLIQNFKILPTDHKDENKIT